jgi:glucose/arabinose dehydrogenase
MTRKRAFIIAGVIIVIAAGIGGWFYWHQLRGIGPALRAPSQDITDLIPSEPAPTGPATNDTSMPLKLPEKVGISIFAKNLGKPRVLAFDPNGVLIVSIPDSGTVVALPDADKNGVADSAQNILTKLNRPHGLAFRCPDEKSCNLFVAESDKVVRYDYDSAKRTVSNAKKILDLPNGGNHFSRTLLLHSTESGDELLVAVGSSCNVCREEDSRRAAITRVGLDGESPGLFASGLRNSVFMVRSPFDSHIWATEMGRDLLGDNIPPDEINTLDRGKNYGWPICYGQKVHDTQFDKNQYIRDPCIDTIAAKVDLPAHSAPLGLAFIPEGGPNSNLCFESGESACEPGWPQDWQGDLLVAFHGSWNRSVPTGYKIVRVKLGPNGEYEGVEDFITGWLTGNTALGRPVDILMSSNGVMYVSDDKAGVVYRASYHQ